MIIQRHAIYQAGRHCGVVAPAGGAATPMAKARGLRRSKENWSAEFGYQVEVELVAPGQAARQLLEAPRPTARWLSNDHGGCSGNSLRAYDRFG